MSRFSDVDISIGCPSCNRKIKKRLSQLGHGRTHRCLCGQRITIEGSGATTVKRELEKLERTIRRLGR